MGWLFTVPSQLSTDKKGSASLVSTTAGIYGGLDQTKVRLISLSKLYLSHTPLQNHIKCAIPANVLV